MAGLPHPVTPEVLKTKVLDYLLDIQHPQGGSKARYFTAFGFQRQQWEQFAKALREHGMTQELRGQRDDGYGPKYEIVCSIKTPDGRNPCVTTIWIAEGSNAPKLVTAIPAGS